MHGRRGLLVIFHKKQLRGKELHKPNAKKKIDKITNSLTWVGTKRAEWDHKHKYGSNTEKEKNKWHKVLADETKPIIPTAAATSQPRRVP